MHGVDAGEIRLQFHHVVEAVDQFAQAGFAADQSYRVRGSALVSVGESWAE